MLVIILVLALCVVQIENRMLLIGSGSRPVNAPGCYVKTINYMLAFNETYSPKDNLSCEQYSCDYDGYTYITKCVDSFEGDCLKVQGNKTLSYPECCDSYDCSKNGKKSPILTKQDTSNENNANSSAKNVENFTTITTDNKSMPYSENAKKSTNDISEVSTADSVDNVTKNNNMSNSDDISVQNKNMSNIEIEKSDSSSKYNDDADSVKTKEDSTTNITQNKNMTDSEFQDNSEKEAVAEKILKDKTAENSKSDNIQLDDASSVNPEVLSETEPLDENPDTEDTSSSKSKNNTDDQQSPSAVDKNETETIDSLQGKHVNLMSVDAKDFQSNEEKKSSDNETKSTVEEKEK